MLSNKTRTRIIEHFGTPKPNAPSHDNSDDFTEISVDDGERYDGISTLSTADKEWSYLGDDILSMDNTTLNVGDEYYHVNYSVNTEGRYPFLSFELEFRGGELVFPMKQIPASGIESFNSDTLTYQGHINISGDRKACFFFKENSQDAAYLEFSEGLIISLVSSELVNTKTSYGYSVAKMVTNTFINYSELLYLIDGNGHPYTSPAPFYFGSYKNRIAVAASLGQFVSSPFASMGPYYYLATFKRAMRYACVSGNHEPVVINDVSITREDTPIWNQGGIVKYAVFMGRTDVFFNRDTDPEDDSKTSQEGKEKSKLIAATMRMRDVDAKWSLQYDSVFHGTVTVTLGLGGEELELLPQVVVKGFDQLVPVNYAYVDTSDVNVIDQEKHKYSDDNGRLM